MSAIALLPLRPVGARPRGAVVEQRTGVEAPAARPAATVCSLLRLLTARLREPGDSDWLARARALIEAGRHALARRLEGGAAEAEIAGCYARMADDALIGLICRSPAGDGPALPAPLTAVAVGRYGARAALPDEPLELILLVPEEPGARRAAEARAAGLMARLRTLGLEAAAITATLEELARCLGARPGPGIAEARFIAGAFGPWAELKARLAERQL